MLSIIIKFIETQLLQEKQQEAPVDFLGVLDGHGGENVSSAIAEHIVEIIEEELRLMLQLTEENPPVTTAFSSPLSSSTSSTSSSVSTTVGSTVSIDPPTIKNA